MIAYRGPGGGGSSFQPSPAGELTASTVNMSSPHQLGTLIHIQRIAHINNYGHRMLKKRSFEKQISCPIVFCVPTSFPSPKPVFHESAYGKCMSGPLASSSNQLAPAPSIARRRKSQRKRQEVSWKDVRRLSHVFETNQNSLMN